MKMNIKIGLMILSISNAILAAPIHLPKGFKLELYAEVPGARQMAVAPNGVIFVGTRELGKVFAVIPNAAKTKGEKLITIAENLFQPNGVAFRQGDLYVAEVNRILRYKNILQHLEKPENPEVIRSDLPDKTHHGWKYIAFSPDDWLYVPVGAPCNICLSDDPRFASILRMKPDGSQLEIFAEGVRNTVGFAWHPETKTLWFTDNGRDWLGPDLPPDELNHAPTAGMHFGFPYLYGNNVPDPKFPTLPTKKRQYTASAMNFQAHVAALGVLFYTGKMFPKSYQNHLLIAQHGSWNRWQKVGYQVIDVTIENNKAIKQTSFATGWLNNGEVTGRPVALAQLADGSVLVSDDMKGLIYRISYH